MNRLRIYSCLSILIIIACSRGPIKELYYKGFSEIKEGESATIKWSFENADYVIIEGLNRRFSPTDSINVTPVKTTKYIIKAYQNETDSLITDWRVYVRQKQQIEPVRGPEILKGMNLSPSSSPAKYLEGIVSFKNPEQINQIRVIRKIYPTPMTNQLGLRVVLIDQFGNYISSANLHDQIKFTFDNISNGKFIPEKIIEKSYSVSTPLLNINLLLDNSSAAESNTAIINYIKDWITSLHSNDLITFSYYNHYNRKLYENLPAANAFLALSSQDLPPNFGLNASYKALYNTISNIDNTDKNYDNICILITYIEDNSSIAIELRDIAELARSKQVPIYIIGVGTALETYNLRYLADATGGYFYFITEDNIRNIRSILKEIVFVQRAYYYFPVTLPNSPDKSVPITVTLDISTKPTDKFRIVKAIENQYADNQILAAFNYRDSLIDIEFDENFYLLAQLLRDNPSTAIQLIGHSSQEGSEEFNNYIALRRAQESRRKLIELGASPNQIRVRTDGSNLPIYYLQNIGWQQYYNRRVEIRWLDPSLMPFEIIAGEYDSEFDALNYVELWERRGFRAYYQRYLKNNFPIYKIKLWGYKTFEDAENAIKLLKKEYKLSLVIE